MKTRNLLALSLATAVLTASAASQSQELYALARFNNIWRIDGFDTATPTPVLVGSWAPPAGTTQESGPLGFDRDPITGDFLILVGAWSSDPANNARLIRFNPTTGDSTLEYELPFQGLFGLERRWDGKLITFDGKNTLVAIDLSDGSTTTTPLQNDLEGLGSLFPAFDLDERGYPQVLLESSIQIDPASGAFQPPAIPDDEGLPFGAFAIANDGDFYAASVFPGNLYRYDDVASSWEVVLDSGQLTMNNVYDFVLTNQTEGEGFERICNGLPNSSGVKATLDVLGVSSANANDLTLVTRDLPGTTTGMYLMGSAAGSIAVASGELCISPTVYRYGASLAIVQDTYAFTADLTALPNGMAAMANTTQIFQLWYRDNIGGTSTSNFSDAIAVNFR